MFRRSLRGQKEAYVESAIGKTSVHFFEAERVKALDIKTAKKVFVEEIEKTYGIHLYMDVVYVEQTWKPGWWRCCAYLRTTERK